MNPSLFFIILITAVFMRCRSETTPIASASIQGVYINYAENEFSKAFDTIVLSVYDPNAATYIIQRRTGFFRIYNGILQPKQYKAESSVGVFDMTHLQLQEQKKGTVYSFTSLGTELFVGASRYTKIK